MGQQILHFTFRGKLYMVDEVGRINANEIRHFSNTWLFLGGSPHHWHNRIIVSLGDAFTDPKQLNGCLGWDSDHGMVWRWGGCFAGKLPRISNAYVTTYSLTNQQ